MVHGPAQAPQVSLFQGGELGATDLGVTDGASNGTAANWIETAQFGANSQQFLYAISDVLKVPGGAIDVSIDIKPGKGNPVCGGAIRVAILGSDSLDVTQIDPSTLSFAGLSVHERRNRAQSCRVRDVNDDGYGDFDCKYANDETDGTVTGALLDGTPIEGSDLFCVLD